MDLSGDSIIYSPKNYSDHLTYTTFAASTLGIVISCVSITILLLTAFLFEQWRRSFKNQLLINLAIARFLYALTRYVFNLGDAFGLYSFSYNKIHYSLLLMIYTEMTLVIWMFLFSREMYERIVVVMSVREKGALMRSCLCAWLIPLPLSILINLLLYSQQESDLVVHLLYIFLMKWPVIIATAALLVMVWVAALRNNRLRNRSNFRIVVFMLLMICTFCFQLLVHDLYLIVYKVIVHRYENVMQAMYSVFVVFNVMMMFQCPISVFFWLFGNAETRRLWSCKGTKEPRVTSFLSHM